MVKHALETTHIASAEGNQRIESIHEAPIARTLLQACLHQKAGRLSSAMHLDGYQIVQHLVWTLDAFGVLFLCHERGVARVPEAAAHLGRSPRTVQRDNPLAVGLAEQERHMQDEKV